MSQKPSRQQSWLGPTLVALACGAMLTLTWRRWPDVTVDYGTQLYTAWQLASGKTLYVDVAHVYGPLSPYLNALAWRFLGQSLMSLVGLNLLILAAILALLYRLLLHVSSHLGATGACLVFVAIFGFGQYMPCGNYNYVTPYVAETTHGLLLFLAAALLLFHYARGGQTWNVLVVGALTGLLSLTKYELLLAGGLAIVFGLVAALYARRHFWPFGLFIAGLVIPPVVALFLLHLRMPWAEALRGVLGAFPLLLDRQLLDLRFYQEGLGFEDPGGNLWKMLRYVGWWALYLLPALAVAANAPGSRRGRAAVATIAFIAAILLATISVDWGAAGPDIARPLPLVMAGLIAATAYAIWVERCAPDRLPALLLRLTLSVFALLMLAKIILYPRVYHYGFVLAMPAALLTVAALLDWIPRTIALRGGSPWVFRAAVIGILTVIASVHLRVTSGFMLGKSFPVGEGGDMFLAEPDRGAAVETARRQVSLLLDPRATLAVFPEGVMLNYLARRANPTPVIAYMPSDLLMHGAERLMRALVRRPPDLIAIAPKNQDEYGQGVFGRDYAVDLGRWIVANYEPLTARRRTDPYGIILLRRKGPAATFELVR